MSRSLAYILPQVTTVTCRGSLPREKKRDRVAHSRGAEVRPASNLLMKRVAVSEKECSFVLDE
eukprot:scaffold63297_cov30-Phaeocystis_antarctica.AAC.1